MHIEAYDQDSAQEMPYKREIPPLFPNLCLLPISLKYPHLMLITSLPIPTSHLCYQVSELTPLGQHDSRVTTPASRHLIETMQHWPSCPTQDTRSLDPMITLAALLPNLHFQLIHELALRLQPLVCVTIRSCRIYSRKHLGNTVHRLHTCYPELGPHEAGDF